MQKAASNTRKTITVSHSAIRHFLARLHSLVTAVAAGISVALTVLTAGAAATAIASKSTTAAGWKHYTHTVPASASPPASKCRPYRCDPRPQWLTMEQAVKHCTQGVDIWDWASSDAGEEPDIVMACCGDTPTLETLAAVTILRDTMPELKIRVVNVVDLMKLEPGTKHPHGLTDADYQG